MRNEPTATWSLVALLFAGMVVANPAVAGEPRCNATGGQTVCRCDLTKLRPLQGAVGMKEVAYKQKTILRHPKREHEKLDQDPIKVVAGPGGELFITDHHHGAEAWLRAHSKWGAKAFCKVVNSQKDLPSNFETEDQFWAALKAKGLVRLKNENGVDIDVPGLPKTLKAMPDDPYRSLAWLVRQNGGFCKSSSEFAEFVWADWFRSRSPSLYMRNIPSDPKHKNETVNKAVELAHSPEAAKLPGYSAVTCAK